MEQRQKKEITMDYDLYIEEKRSQYNRGVREGVARLAETFKHFDDKDRFYKELFGVAAHLSPPIFKAIGAANVYQALREQVQDYDPFSPDND